MAIVPIVIVLAVVIGVASGYFMPDDNPVEEIAEKILESQLNLPSGSLDLTPGSPEKKR